MSGVLLVAAVMGCDQASAPQTALRFDSAGVEIVLNPGGEKIPVFNVSESPLLEIGSEGDPDYEFFRVTDVLPLPGSRILVANSGTKELRVYDTDGILRGAIGGDGEGPGEFRQLGPVFGYAEDSLVTYDPSLRRISVFDGSLRYAHAFPLQPPLSDRPTDMSLWVGPTVHGVFDDGSLLIHLWDLIYDPQGVGEARTETAVARWNPVTGDIVRFGNYPTLDYYKLGQMAYRRWPLGKVLAQAAGGDRLFLTTGRGYEIQEYSENGDLLRIIREARNRIPITGELSATYLRGLDESARARIESIPFPDSLPAYDRLVVAGEGHLWARHFPSPDSSTQTWVIFDAEGVRLGRIDLPSMFNLRNVRDGRLFGLVTDDLGVQEVLVYGFQRTSE